MSSHRKSHRKSSTSHSNEGEFLWLVSLSDLMILLFVFFVVLFSFSFQKMKLADFEQMAAVLRGNKQAEKTPLDEVQAQLVQSLNASALKDAVDVTQQDHSLILDIKDKVLFDSGQYHLSKNGLDLLKIISTSLKHIPTTYRLGVEGHTDDIPIHVPGISDNWELSAKRAHSVLISLDLEDNLKRRSVVMGFGEMEPLFPNRDGDGNPLPANRAKNRRVTLRVF